jgi:hypothetical protein
MAVLAVLIVWKAVALVVLLGLLLVVGHRLRTKPRRDLENDGGHTALQGPVLQIGPRVGWYIRAVDWPDADL